MKTLNLTVCLLALMSLAGLSNAADRADLPTKKRTMANLYLTAQEAAEFVQSDEVLFVDVRTRAEVNFLGLPLGADVNIPFMVLPAFPEFNETKGTYSLEVNEFFADDVLEYVDAHAIGIDAPIVLICRSGSRSARAADILTDMGFTQVYSVVDGYEGDKAKEGPHAGQRVVNGWRNSDVGWTYKIKRTQVYQGDAI